MDILNNITTLKEIDVTSDRVGPNPNLSYPTDFNLIELSLQTNKTIIDNLRPYLVEFNYYEDLFDNSVSAKIVLTDAIGLFGLGELNGTEKITAVFNAGTGGSIIRKTFRVYSVSNRHFDNGMQFENYTLNLCSEELLSSEKYRISKSYKKSSVDSIITDILKNTLKTNKNIYIDSSMGSYDFVLPNKKIFETINWLSTYARAPNSRIGADMLFYENAKGYHFKSLQSLYEKTPEYTYYYNPKNVSTDMNLKSANIYRLQVMNNFDTLGATSKGMFNNRTISIDPLTRKKHISDFNYDQYFKKSKSLNDNTFIPTNVNSYIDVQGKKIYDSPSKNLETGALRLVVSNASQQKTAYIKDIPGSVQNDFFVENNLPNRIAQLYLSQYNRLKILVPGNSGVTVGDTIQIKILGTTALSNENNTKKEDSVLSGKYLITAIRHIINVTRYTTVIEVSKESLTS